MKRLAGKRRKKRKGTINLETIDGVFNKGKFLHLFNPLT